MLPPASSCTPPVAPPPPAPPVTMKTAEDWAAFDPACVGEPPVLPAVLFILEDILAIPNPVFTEALMDPPPPAFPLIPPPLAGFPPAAAHIGNPEVVNGAIDMMLCVLPILPAPGPPPAVPNPIEKNNISGKKAAGIRILATPPLAPPPPPPPVMPENPPPPPDPPPRSSTNTNATPLGFFHCSQFAPGLGELA